MENLLEVITVISNYFIKLEVLQEEYDTLLQNYIADRKREAAKKSWERRENSSSSSNGFTFTKKGASNTNKTYTKTNTNKKNTDTNTNNFTFHNQTNNDKTKNTKFTLPKTEKAKQYQKKIEEERADKRWDTYTFFEPHKDKQKLEKKTLQRLKPKITLCKILKKIYHRLLLKLHPDRSPLENSEQVCKRLVKCYKSADYFYLFHMFKVIDCKIYLSKVECNMLTSFINQEIRRIRVTLKILQENIYKFKNYKE